MPDGVVDLQIPIEGEGNMATDLPDAVANQMLASLMQSGNVAQNNFLTVSKAADYDYYENKRVVNLDEAMGAREVTGPLPLGK